MKKHYPNVLLFIMDWFISKKNISFAHNQVAISNRISGYKSFFFLFAILLIFTLSFSQAQPATITWGLIASPGPGTSNPVNANLSIANADAGANFNTTAFGANGMATAGVTAGVKGWNEANVTDATNSSAYVEFGVTVLNCSTAINITGISFTTKTSAGTITVARSLFKYSTNNFASSTNVGSGTLQQPASITASAQSYTLLNINCPPNKTITFRLYGWGIGNNNSALNILNFVITGTYSTPTAVTTTCTVNNNVCNPGSSNGQATATGTAGGTGPYTYLWNDAASTTSTVVNNLAAGTYTVTVTDANGCTGTKSVTIQEPTNPLSVVCNSTNISCNGASDGTVITSVSDGVFPYQYLWSNNSITPSISGLAPGNFTVTVTDALGCVVTCSKTITTPNAIVLNCSHTNITCFGNGNGTASAPVQSGGTPPYSYIWSNGQATQTATGLVPGTYTCTVTDANNCTKTCSQAIVQPGLLTIQCSIDQQVCLPGGATGSAHVNVNSGGTAPFSYFWSTNAVTPSITGLNANTYTVTVTDGNGCTKTCSLTITEPLAQITIPSTKIDVACKGDATGSITLNTTGGYIPYTYSWSNGANTAILSNLSSGTYTVTVTDVGGCTKTKSITISEPLNVLGVTISNTVDVLCKGYSTGEISIAVTGGTSPYTYSWSNGDNNEDITSLAAGVYTVIVTDQNGCTKTKSATINEPLTYPSANAVTDANVLCFGGNNASIHVTASGGTPGTPPNDYTYSWNTVPVITTTAVTGLTAGTYVVTVTDGNGCTITASTQVTEPPALVAIVSAIQDTLCQGETLYLQFDTIYGGVLPYTFAWTGPGFSDIVEDPVLINAQPGNSGNYSVTVIDTNLCVLADIINNVKVYEMPVLTTTSPDTICSGQPLNDTITTQINSGITYSWTINSDVLVSGMNPNPNPGSNNIITDILTNSSVALSGICSYNIQLIYTNTVGFQCINIDTLNIVVNPKPPESDFATIENVTNNDTICGGSENMSFYIDGASGYSFSWIVSPSNVSVGLADDQNPPYDSSNVIITFPDNDSVYQATIKAITNNIESLGGCKSSPKEINLYVKPNGITERVIVLRDPGHLLIYLDNTVDGYQWGYDSLPTLKPEIIPGQIFQVFVPEGDKFLDTINNTYQLDTARYLFWVLVYQADGKGDTCQTKVYYNGSYAKRPGKPLDPLPTEIITTVSPNPNNGNFDLLVSGNIYDKLNIRIFNSTGQLVSQQYIEKSEGSETYSVDLGKVESGLYVLRLSDEYGAYYMVKFLIN